MPLKRDYGKKTLGKQYQIQVKGTCIYLNIYVYVHIYILLKRDYGKKHQANNIRSRLKSHGQVNWPKNIIHSFLCMKLKILMSKSCCENSFYLISMCNF